jgi:ribose 1,5-bisphosphokinase
MATPERAGTARLFYLMGASGAGKDSLLSYARQRLAGDLRVTFAHRYITRPAGAGSENHVALTAQEFELRHQLGCFAMDWRAHGLRYGIGREIDIWLGVGIDVVVNGSRGYFDEAAARYPALIGVVVEASPAILAARLQQRGREAPADIAARLERRELDAPTASLLTLRNDGPLAEAGERLVRILAGDRWASAGC